ncbi:DUF4340 domain-containing protein [Nannocystaceae bacterium ST9]
MTRGTVIMVLLAALAVAGAVSMRPIELPPPTFEDTGEPLFPGFEDPNAAAFLEVKSYDKASAQLTAFSVKLDHGRWVIPSHNNYPADGTEQMGKAAASFLGAKKDVVRSDDAKEHAKFGVLDPEDGSGAEEGLGQRVTIKDGSGSVLVDIIVGNDVPDRQGYKFVRYPGENRVYASELDPKISTKFVDWIEKDLLKLEEDSIVALVSNSYKVDEQSGTVVDDSPVYLEKRDQGDFTDQGAPNVEWQLAAPPVFGPDGKLIDPATYTGDTPLPQAFPTPEGKELNPTKVKQIISAADRLQIVGVRPQPEKLTAIDLLSKGFFVGGEPQRLFGNEGEVRLFCDDGVVYSLYFGEVTYATGVDLTAGSAGEKPDSVSEEENARANRFMFVDIGYDPTRDAKAGEPPAEGELRGKARAEALAQRFNRWYYVIPDSSFTQLHKLPADFWRDAKAP